MRLAVQMMPWSEMLPVWLIMGGLGGWLASYLAVCGPGRWRRIALGPVGAALGVAGFLLLDPAVVALGVLRHALVPPVGLVESVLIAGGPPTIHVDLVLGSTAAAATGALALPLAAGRDRRPVSTTGRRAVSGLLSGLVTGLGQARNGQPRKAVVLVALQIALAWLVAVAPGGALRAGFAAFAVVALFGVADAARYASGDAVGAPDA